MGAKRVGRDEIYRAASPVHPSPRRGATWSHFGGAGAVRWMMIRRRRFWLASSHENGIVADRVEVIAGFWLVELGIMVSFEVLARGWKVLRCG